MNGRTAFTAACTLAGASLWAASGAVLAQAADQRTVSSDGSALAVTAPQRGTASASFEGAAQAGAAPDAKAEFPAMTLSAAEYAAFSQRFRPKRAPYARGGMAQPETVIGRDRRFRVYPRDSGFPYRAIGLLTYSQAGGSFFCTAFLISEDTIATAGHCVHEGGPHGTWSYDLRFYPAFNAGTAPYGSCSGRRLYAVARWTEQGSEEHDYGAVKLNCRVGETTGWLGYYPSAVSQVGLATLLMGYPGDKPYGTLWGGAGAITASEPRKTRYQIDTGAGQSGAPLIEADRGPSRADCYGTCAVAIHAYGQLDGSNSGTRINHAVADNLTAWRNAP